MTISKKPKRMDIQWSIYNLAFHETIENVEVFIDFPMNFPWI